MQVELLNGIGAMMKQTFHKEKKMITKKTWEEFGKCGLLLFINQILHIFGWAICLEYDDKQESITDVYPARVKFRGFDNNKVSESYKNLSKYIMDNAKILYEEACE